MKLAVIIVNYNVRYFLEQALEAVFKSVCNFPFEVYVVDNNSIDSSVEMVKNRFPQVKLIVNTENTGFSRANNQAMRDSNATYMLLLNPDTIIQEDTLQKSVDFMDMHPDAGGLGVKMIDGQGKFLPESKRGFPTPEVAFYKMSGLSKIFPKSKIFNRYHLGFLDNDSTHQVDVLSGAFMLMRKAVLDKVGLLDEDYFMYGEDIDLSYRIKKGGFENYYFAGTSIIHFKGESTKKGSLNYVKVFYQAMIIFAKKHISGGKDGFYTYMLQWAIYLRALLAIVSRTWKMAGPLLMDGLLLTGVLFSAEWLWENVFRASEGLIFPETLYYVNFPVYLFIWLMSIFLSGGHDRQSKLFQLWSGLSVGTIIIGFVYGFMNLEFRVSRGMILYTFLVGGILMSLWRYLLSQFTGNGNRLFFASQNVIVLGKKASVERVLGLLQQMMVKRDYLGFISPEDEDKSSPQMLGSLDKATEIISMLHPDEVIFCAGDIPSFEIIRQISHLDKNVEFKIASNSSAAIIGSHSKDDAGELFTLDIGFKIQTPYLKRLKIFTDIHVSLVLIPLIPILVFFQKKPLRFIKNIFSVLFLKKSWVSYCTEYGVSDSLPAILPGVLSPLDNLTVRTQSHDKAFIKRMNYVYARDYSPVTDLRIILNSLNRLDA